MGVILLSRVLVVVLLGAGGPGGSTRRPPGARLKGLTLVPASYRV